MKPRALILLGGGGHCRSCIDVIEREGRYRITGILDRRELVGTAVLGCPVIATDEEAAGLVDGSTSFLVTVGQIRSAEIRVRLFEMLVRLGADIATVVSPSAEVSRHAALGRGAIVMHHAVVNAGARIGENCIINSQALVEHDAEVGDHCHVSTGAIVNGGVRVGERCFIGSHATCVHGCVVPARSFLRAHSLFTGAPAQEET